MRFFLSMRLIPRNNKQSETAVALTVDNRNIKVGTDANNNKYNPGYLILFLCKIK